jgi:predicted transcriptional regulator
VYLGKGMAYLGPLKSELKIRILLSLLEGEKKIGDIRVDLKSGETTILHTLKDLEGLNLTTRSGGIYKLTSLGLLEAQICKYSSSAAEVLEKFKDFWLFHDLSTLPSSLVLKIGALRDSTLIRAEVLELGKVYKTFNEILMKSSKVTGISPIFHANYIPVIEHLLSQKVPVELILTQGVLTKTLALAKLDNLKKSFESDTLKIYLKENLKVALTVTDKNFSLGLFKGNGEYDDNMDLLSLNKEAIEWGEELFLNTLKDSKRIDMEALI